MGKYAGLLVALVAAVGCDMPTAGNPPDGAGPEDLATGDRVPLDGGAGDFALAVDLATPDLAMADFATSDLAIPDLVIPDLASPDLITPSDLSSQPAPDLSPADGGMVGQCGVGCPNGTHDCSGGCVSNADPYFGCGASSCSPCQLPHAIAGCSQGGCAIQSCHPGWADCDGNPSNGCEADHGSLATCGSCSLACANGTKCSQGQCVSACSFPLTDCNGSCRDVGSDPNACGSCTNDCEVLDESCTSGSCTNSPCLAGYTYCYGSCRDVSRDPTACGTSCTRCPAGPNEVATCAGGVCGFACALGTVLCNGGCVDEQHDPAHCGACGAPCGGGQVCISGTCQPASAIRLVTGLTQAEAIVADGTNVYWTDIGTNSVWKVDRAGKTPVQLASNEAKPWRIAVDGSYVYWSSNLGGAIRRAPIDGSQPAETVASASSPRGIAVDANYVYWVEGSGFYKAPKGANMQKTLVASPAIFLTGQELLRDGNFLYSYQDDGNCTAFRIDLTNGAVTTIYSYAVMGMAENLALSSTTLYSAYKNSDPFIYLGWESKTLTSGVSMQITFTPTEMDADDCALYIATETGTIYRLENGSVPIPLTTAAVQSHRLALDDAYVYWTDPGGGFIGRLPK